MQKTSVLWAVKSHTVNKSFLKVPFTKLKICKFTFSVHRHKNWTVHLHFIVLFFLSKSQHYKMFDTMFDLGGGTLWLLVGVLHCVINFLIIHLMSCLSTVIQRKPEHIQMALFQYSKASFKWFTFLCKCWKQNLNYTTVILYYCILSALLVLALSFNK